MNAENTAQKYLLDSWRDWVRAERLPWHEGAWADISALELRPWARLGEGCRSAFLQLAGRGDFLTLQILEIEPGAATTPARHLFDEIFFARVGEGVLCVEGGPAIAFGERALFALPRNRAFNIANASERESLHLVSLSNLPFLMNFFRAESFLFDNLVVNNGAKGSATHVICDVGAVDLAPYAPRGPGFSKADISPQNSILHAHVCEIPAYSYIKARRHGQGTHILPLGDSGYSLAYREDARTFECIDWRDGLVLAPGEDMFLQHFNTGATPARNLVLSLGGAGRPLLERKVERMASAHLDVKSGGTLIEYEDEHPEIASIFAMELVRRGFAMRMPTTIMEARR